MGRQVSGSCNIVRSKQVNMGAQLGPKQIYEP